MAPKGAAFPSQTLKAAKGKKKGASGVSVDLWPWGPGTEPSYVDGRQGLGGGAGLT